MSRSPAFAGARPFSLMYYTTSSVKFTLTLFVLLLTLTLATPMRAAIVTPPPVTATATADVASLDRHAVEANLGRKLTLKERVAFGIAKRKARRDARRAQETSQGNGMAVAGFVCSLVGLFLFGIILGPLGIVFSAIGLSKAKKEGRPLRGLALAGLILGIVATLGWLIVIAAVSGGGFA